MRKKYIPFLSLSALAFSACTTFESRPIDLKTETTNWETATNEATREHTILTLADAQIVGLVFSPELNRSRAKLAQSKAVEAMSGLWQDPDFSMSVKRTLSTSAQPWAYSPGLSLTLPITGLPGLEKEIAAFYSEADYWQLAQAELDFRSELAMLWVDYSATKKKLDFTDAYLQKTILENDRLEQLAEAGEITQDEMQAAEDRENATERERQALHLRLVELHADIMRKLGLKPNASAEIKLDTNFPEEIPACIISPSAEELAEQPKMRAALATYNASEIALKTEIRKQYPELSLSPSYEIDGNDEFEDSFTLGVGFSLPLWNRNRRGIAEATGTREVLRIETLTLWQEQFYNLRRLERAQIANESYCRKQQQRAKNLHERLEKIYRAIDIGELSPAVLSEAAQQSFEASLAYFDSLAEFHKTRVQVNAMKQKCVPAK